MRADAQRLLADCLLLPVNDRAELAGRLIESLDSDCDKDEVGAWESEIARRVAELDSGNVRTITWAEARDQILRASDEQVSP